MTMEPVVTRDINRTCPMAHDPQFCRKWFLVLLRNVHFGSKYLKLRTGFPFFFFIFAKSMLTFLKNWCFFKAHANLEALREANTNPANFVLHEIALIVVKGFSKDLVPFWAARAIHSKKYCHPFEQLWLPVRKRNVIPMTQAIRLLKLSSVWIARAIRLKNSHPFTRLTTFRNHFCSNRLWRTWQKM